MIELLDAPIDTAQVLARVRDPQCGAEVLFVGTTRQWTRQWTQPPAGSRGEFADREPPVETSHLIYEAYREMALVQLAGLEAEARRRWPLRQVAIVHRLGRVEPTEASVAIAVSCPHRREAFEAGQWLIDEIKHQVPIWKQEHYVQRGAEWIHPTSGSCRCDDQRPLAAGEQVAPLPLARPTTPQQADRHE